MNTTQQQFEAFVAGHTAVLEYEFRENSIAFTHTEVPYAIQRRGIGSTLARAGLDYARKHGFSVLPYCPFVEQYIRRHPEELSLVEPGYRAERFHENA